MMLPAPDSLSAAQRAFLERAEALGATGPANARPLPDLPVVPRAELDELIERGLVREAADWRYYVYRSRRSVTPMLSPSKSPITPGRLWKTLLFWLIMVLIPIVLLQLTGRN